MSGIDMRSILEGLVHWAATAGLKALLIIVAALVLLKAANVLVRKVFAGIKSRSTEPEYQKRADTLSSVLKYVIDLVIIITAGMVILNESGIEIGPILAAAGVVGVAVGFGAQSLVQDVIAGFFILVEDQIRVGDVVQIAGKGGIVEKVNLRMTILRDLEGNVHFIRNGNIDVVTNMTKEYSRYVFDVGVSYREDVDEVIGVIKEIDEEMRSDPEYMNDILEPIEILGLDEFADSAVIIKARTKTVPIMQWRVGREFKRRLKRKFDQKGIEIPFPHLTLYMGQGKQGESPPLNVVMKENQGPSRDA